MGKSTISMAIFNSELLVYQRVKHIKTTFRSDFPAKLRIGVEAQ
jgi:hypothetical protein